MARKHQLIALAAFALLIGGCVTSKDKYDALRLENEELRAKLGDADARYRTAQAQADAYKDQIGRIGDGASGQSALIKNMSDQNALLAAENADLKRRYEDALKNTSVALPREVSNALDDFARQNADLIDFDSARGIVKFKSDVTFATGSADVTDKAKQAIGRFAQILNSDAAKSYELMVAGHTDSTPVVNPATKAKHPDNWYLSSHRAIAVAQALMSQGVGSQRIGATGYGDQRPTASNGTAEGKAQNRRVEVMILPSTVRSASKVTPAKTTGTPAKKNGLSKDTHVAPPPATPRDNK